MASSLGKMSTTSGHRLIFAVEALDRICVVRFGAVLGREGHVGEHLGLVLVQERGELGQLTARFDSVALRRA